jgi:hypothetical protein
MNRIVRVLLLAVALFWAQQGALLHAFEHAVHDLEVALYDGEAPALGHGVEECVAYDALGHALAGKSSFAEPEAVSFAQESCRPTLAPIATRIVFDSRAPPYSA